MFCFREQVALEEYFSAGPTLLGQVSIGALRALRACVRASERECVARAESGWLNG